MPQVEEELRHREAGTSLMLAEQNLGVLLQRRGGVAVGEGRDPDAEVAAGPDQFD